MNKGGTMKLSELELSKEEILLRDGEFECFGLLNYEDAPSNILSFFGNRGFSSHLYNKKISSVICSKNLVDYLPEHIKGVILSDNPLYSFWNLNTRYGKGARFNFDTKIGSNCNISSLASISARGVIIGNNVTIEEFVSIKEGTTIEDNVIVHSGTVLGGNCLELSRKDDSYFVAPLYGGLNIGEGTYIGYNNTFIRGTFEWKDASVGKNARIDSNNFISHNVRIGENTIVTAGVIINGDVTVGNEVWISPGSNITNSIQVGNNSNIMLGSKVTHSIDDDHAFVDGKVYDNRVLKAVRKKG